MDSHSQPDKLPSALAEEVLRAIYGDDFTGCCVNPNKIAMLIQDHLKQQQSQTRELLELYEKVVEAIDLLSTPPDGANITDPSELRALLSERLDNIHSVTTRTIQTAARARGK